MRSIPRARIGDEAQFTKLIDRVAASSVKKARRKRNRSYWGKPKVVLKRGFDAFIVKKTTVTSDGKKVFSTEVVAPETGIHSRAWADEIVPQTGFLTLPIEIRHRIYDDLFEDAIIQNPRKHETKYTTSDKPSTTIETYNILSQISRQTYVDVVGGSLLYRFARFVFRSPDTMTRYLACINPAHRSALRKIDLTISLTNSSPAIHSTSLKTLSSLPSLQSLKVIISVSHNICQARKGLTGYPTWAAIPRRVQVRQAVVDKLAQADRWKDIKGLNEFQMIFQGTRVPGSQHSLGTNGTYYARWADGLYTDDPRLLEIEKDVREAVTRRCD